MKGQVLHYDDKSGVGQISGDDGIRYNFTRADLKQLVPIGDGTEVDFDFEGKAAHDIYVVNDAARPAYDSGPKRYTGPVEPDRGLFEYFMRTFTANYANFKGRARRKEYWGFYLFYTIALIIIGIIVAAGGATADPVALEAGDLSSAPLVMIGFILGGIFILASLLPSLALLVRRLHDIGQSGWLVLIIVILGLIPYLGFLSSIAIIVIGVIDTKPEENKYGPPPKHVT